MVALPGFCEVDDTWPMLFSSCEDPHKPRQCVHETIQDRHQTQCTKKITPQRLLQRKRITAPGGLENAVLNHHCMKSPCSLAHKQRRSPQSARNHLEVHASGAIIAVRGHFH